MTASKKGTKSPLALACLVLFGTGLSGCTLLDEDQTSGMLRGTAARGEPIAGATVAVKDDRGGSALGLTASDGTYEIDAKGLRAPYLVRVGDGGPEDLYSVGGKAGVVNVHPLTDLIVRTWYEVQGTSAPQAFASTSGEIPSTREIETITAVVSELVQALLVANGVDAQDFDLFTTPFEADGTGFDALLDGAVVGEGSLRISGPGGLQQTSTIEVSGADVTITSTTAGPSGTSSVVATSDSSGDPPPEPRLALVVDPRVERHTSAAGTTTQLNLFAYWNDADLGRATAYITGGPWTNAPIPDSGGESNVEGHRFTQGALSADVTAFPPAGTTFRFRAGAETRDVVLEATTTEAISITNLQGFDPSDAKPGQPLRVEWTLPKTFAVAHVELQMSAYVGSAKSCIGPHPDLEVTSTSASSTIPAACDGLPIDTAQVCVFVTGTHGERTVACHDYFGSGGAGAGDVPTSLAGPWTLTFTPALDASACGDPTWAARTLTVAADGSIAEQWAPGQPDPFVVTGTLTAQGFAVQMRCGTAPEGNGNPGGGMGGGFNDGDFAGDYNFAGSSGTVKWTKS